jgi:hypothetical protein
MNNETRKYRPLPLNILSGVCMARKTNIFEGMDTLPLKCAVQGLDILSSFPQIPKTNLQATCCKRYWYRFLKGFICWSLTRGSPKGQGMRDTTPLRLT